MELPKFKSHKIVGAAPVEFTTETAVHVRVDGVVHGVNVDPSFFARGTPQPGDYLVRYEPDGYLSWSPKDKFEDGNTRV